MNGSKLAGDVVPLPSTRPSVNTFPTPGQKYLPGYSPYMPNYNFDWHQILTPPPSNDASQFMNYMQQIAALGGAPEYTSYPYPQNSGARIPETRMYDAPLVTKEPGLKPVQGSDPSFPGSEAYLKWLHNRSGPAPQMPFVAYAREIEQGKANVPQDVQAMQQGMVYGPGPVRGQLHLLPQYQNLGQIRPFGPGEWINRVKPDGTTGWSSEETTSVQFPNGKFAVVPTLWMVNGQAMTVDEDTALQYAQQSGLNWPMFNTENEAELWSQQRESRWNQVPIGRSDMQPPLWSRQFPPRQ